MIILDGKKLSGEINQQLKDEIKGDIDVPGLAVIQVGNVAASSVYVKAKTKSALEVGIEVFDHHLEDSITQKDLLTLSWVKYLKKQHENCFDFSIIH